MGGTEPEGLGRAVDVSVFNEPDAFEVDGHVDLFAGVGVIAVEPDFIERRGYLLGPHLVEEDVGGQFVCIAAVDHQFVLVVQERHGAQRLIVREVQCVRCPRGECREHEGKG